MSLDADATMRARTGTDTFEREALDLLLFDEAQQLALRFHRQFIDAIRIERALAGKLEASRTRHRGVGKAPELLTEQLRLDQRGRQHRAVRRRTARAAGRWDRGAGGRRDPCRRRSRR
jgi:hypothetical protein